MSDQSRETVGKVVPVGYKQTEVGVIPEDWDCLDFSDIFTCRQGMQVPVEKQSFFESTNTVRFIRIIDLTDKQEPPRYISNPGDKYVIKKTDLFDRKKIDIAIHYYKMLLYSIHYVRYMFCYKNLFH